MSIGVYVIANTCTGETYIGSSKNIESRLYHHFYLLKHNKHHSSKLQEAYRTYGSKHFLSSIVKKCSIKNLHSCERWYLIDKQPEYNMRIPNKL